MSRPGKRLPRGAVRPRAERGGPFSPGQTTSVPSGAANSSFPEVHGSNYRGRVIYRPPDRATHLSPTSTMKNQADRNNRSLINAFIIFVCVAIFFGPQP